MTKYAQILPEDLQKFPRALPAFIYAALRGMEKSFPTPFQGTEEYLYNVMFVKDAPENTVFVDKQLFLDTMHQLIEQGIIYKYAADCSGQRYCFSVNPQPVTATQISLPADTLEYIKGLQNLGITPEQLKTLFNK